MKKITKNTTLEEILKIKGAEDVLAKFNLPCLSCPMASFEMGRLKIGEVAKVYSLDLKNLLKELNKLTKSK
jgi:hypothetical protein